MEYMNWDITSNKQVPHFNLILFFLLKEPNWKWNHNVETQIRWESAATDSKYTVIVLCPSTSPSSLFVTSTGHTIFSEVWGEKNKTKLNPYCRSLFCLFNVSESRSIEMNYDRLTLLEKWCVFRNISLKQTKHTRWPTTHTLKWWALLASLSFN